MISSLYFKELSSTMTDGNNNEKIIKINDIIIIIIIIMTALPQSLNS